MNREQKRKFVKKAKSKGIPEEYIEAYIVMLEAGTTIPVIPEGAKVRLDVEKIKAGKNYVRMNPEYKEFVESSEGVTFTAHVEEGCFVSLKENPKWLFWSGDLSRVEDV